ncbi:hypothetical protein [Candidatus Magnetaquicoccus inordinatus]|uniref:hypothetical protein n=1 Tax=Candidatus Magnetaquicoccus inordinatus TaxID=2496818 RepID=UPI00102B232C|nr:hypothetical protein [Candidatus Magnetaquicoccus inordinatus]
MKQIHHSPELLILLCHFQKSRLGIEAKLIASGTRWNPAHNINNASYFHRCLNLQDDSPHYADPYLLLPQPQLNLPGGLIVDRLQGLLSIPYHQLHPWPTCLFPAATTPPYWAIALPACGPILLLDLHNLMKTKA